MRSMKKKAGFSTSKPSFESPKPKPIGAKPSFIKKPFKSSKKPEFIFESEGFLVEGMSVLKEYLRFKKSAILQVFCKETALDQVQQLLADTSVKFQTIEDFFKNHPQIDKDIKLPSYSPVWAFVKEEYLAEQEFYQRLSKANKTTDLIIALDHITDPHNLGSIARSAAFFGVKDILLPKARQAHLTRGAFASSQGGFALCNLVLISNLAQTLEKLKKEGYWIIASDMNGETFGKLSGFYDKVVLILGSEDSGISELVRKRSDRIVSIQGQEGALESLNVGVAAGILIQAFSTAAKK